MWGERSFDLLLLCSKVRKGKLGSWGVKNNTKTTKTKYSVSAIGRDGTSCVSQNAKQRRCSFMRLVLPESSALVEGLHDVLHPGVDQKCQCEACFCL